METPTTLPILEPEEIRVLGALMEKARTTPDYYPMTINALTAACNQKTSRKPVVHYTEETIITTLNSLKKKGLVATATGGTSRAVKYKHNVGLVFPLDTSEIAILCLLFLRGPQTPGELNTNTGRLYEFESLEDVQAVLEKLGSLEPAFVQQLPRRTGQKEMRYTHLLSGEPDLSMEDTMEEEPVLDAHQLETRLALVELELAQLKEAFGKLMKELMG